VLIALFLLNNFLGLTNLTLKRDRLLLNGLGLQEARLYDNCKKGKPGKKGFPRFRKHQTHGSVEYKTTGWVRSVSSKNRESNFKVYEEQEFNLSYWLNTTLDNLMTMRV
jgi:transposase